MKLTAYNNYIFYWIASTLSYFGTYVTSLALQVLVVVHLQGNTIDVGWINASRWIPYVLLGLMAGVLIDRVSRRSVLIVTDFGRAALLVLICLLTVLDVVNVSFLMIIMMLFGALSLFNDAASQSFVPQLVPKDLLMPAYARLEQSAAVAETSGPAVAGMLIAVLSAPFALLANAGTYLFSGFVMASIKHSTRQEAPQKVSFKEQIKDGLRWVYHHRYLKTLALNTHAWFLFHSMIGAILVTFALTELGFSASTFGFVMTAAGVGALLGTTLSTRLNLRWGIGRSMAIARLLYCPAVIIMVLAPSAEQGNLLLSTFVLIGVGQFLYGCALGIEGPLEMGYRQTITPSHLHGRMNATMRSINRSMIVIGAPLGGLIADMFGFRAALGVVIVGLAVVGIWFFFSPMRHARLDETETTDKPLNQ
ncbi:MFS transporter [Bacillus horti]|uniref:MFS family permease n=1 Tax=Caldalkalibacillus horti TaxID=77523 RepID=A0ABT9VW31_9BACI|nr:MFS transporter [Bacillus horti]MDQ0165017.1 MFS family permease [Bacillus horti]